MQFPSGIVLVCIGLQRYVTCVFELHAIFAGMVTGVTFWSF